MAQDNLTNLLSQLSVQSAQSEHTKAEQTCQQLLNSGCTNPGDILKNLLVSIIKQDKYEHAITVLQKFKHIDEKYGNKVVLEKLYIYYKLNQVQKFEKLFNSRYPDGVSHLIKSNKANQTQTKRGVLHVRAQFCYRNGQYDESYMIYNYLASTNDDNSYDNTLELACNERVPLSTKPNLSTLSPLVTQLSEESYDLLYNEAIILTTKEEFDQSISLLEKALSMAKNEGYESDIVSIQLQLAYVYQLMANKGESKDILNELLSKVEPGSVFHILAKNNIQSFIDFSKYSTNFNLILRDINFEKANSLNLQNFTFEQWSMIQRNYLFLKLFNNNSLNPHSSLLSRTLHNYSKLVDNIALETYKTQSKKTYHHALTMINSSTGGSTIGFVLLTLQLLIVEKQWDNAIRLSELFLNKSLEKSSSTLLDESIKILSYILFELYGITNRSNSKYCLLQKLFYFVNEPNVSDDSSFWTHVGFQFLPLGSTKEARKIFRQISLYSNDNDDKVSLIKDFLSNESFDINKGAEIVSNVDVESLIAQGIDPLLSSDKKKINRTVINKITKEKLLIKHKKRKAQKLKKFLKSHNVDLSSKPPSNERWIPLRDRSTYRPKRRQQHQAVKQTQGSIINKKAEQALDISKKTTPKPKSSNAKKNKKKGRR
ncbi:signal recognition particle subunit SRP72 NDAI_0F01590 [Naumovozyma dairenensis CBS 421]|uniref:Signal recognition particle subunit SRP72 n=1 Tax=Naumovozyma dairenensis (strain ATCC 10597 / BCRC 20456 / CBS 421 / NBRC 0211 / NRRL Y-12639) TaxID=1071378 RepID=G0WCG7_NAUDC|nr:hypothetical protein NDAI_0F01590 [Naumovozyma dairenensis CBS 421]CCD25478.1 hypothetical protein NDAI_0F01590 [Naumovozyma dairenensis CBS 421]